MDAVDSMTNLLGAEVFKDGTVAKDFGGLQYLISGTPSTQSDVGGINPSTSGNEYWRNQVGDAVSAFNTSNEGISAISLIYRFRCVLEGRLITHFNRVVKPPAS